MSEKNSQDREMTHYKTSTHGPVQKALWRTRDMGMLHQAYAVLEALGIPKDCDGSYEDCHKGGKVE